MRSEGPTDYHGIQPHHGPPTSDAGPTPRWAACIGGAALVRRGAQGACVRRGGSASVTGALCPSTSTLGTGAGGPARSDSAGCVAAALAPDADARPRSIFTNLMRALIKSFTISSVPSYLRSYLPKNKNHNDNNSIESVVRGPGSLVRYIHDNSIALVVI